MILNGVKAIASQRKAKAKTQQGESQSVCFALRSSITLVAKTD
jgi:hypothetical protein